MNDELFMKYKGLVVQVMKDLHCRIRSEDEFENYFVIGFLGLMTALKHYDEEKGKSKYLYLGIKTAITNEFKKRTAEKRQIKTISLNYLIADEIEFLDTIAVDSFEHNLINKIYVEELLSKLKNTRYKQCLIEYYGIGCPALTMPKIALKYGITSSCVRQYIQRALELLRKEIKNDNIKQNKNKIQSKLVK